jgi:hypothetical protein
MTTNVRALAALGLALGLLGTAGAGIFLGQTPEKLPAAAPAQKADPPAKEEPGAPAKVNPPAKASTAQTPTPAGTKGTTAVLDEKLGVEVSGGIPLRELFDLIEERTDLVVRVDVAAFRRMRAFESQEGGDGPDRLLQHLQVTRVVLPGKAARLPVRDVLGDALAQVQMQTPWTYQVRGNQLVIVPAYQPSFAPGVNPLEPGEEASHLDDYIVREQVYGGVVAVTADRRPLADIIADLRRQTGANIVLDPRCQDQAGKAALSIALSDVRLYDALRVIADMAELKLVYAGNIYYITTTANARTFQPPRPPLGGALPAPAGTP